jgi:hypothetical protein
MESSSSTTTTKYQQVIVDVPEERVAEFHAFFARFLAGRSGRRGRGRHGRPGFGPHGHRCEGRGESAEPGADPQTSGVSDV